MASSKLTPSQLYDVDYYAWVEDQARALREHQTEQVDWENVAEEIDDLAKGEERSMESHLETLIEHLLKLAYAPAATRTRNTRQWRGTARLARAKLRRRLDQSPRLRGKMREFFAVAYEDGRTSMLARINVPETIVPAGPLWTLEEVLDDNFVPNRPD